MCGGFPASTIRVTTPAGAWTLWWRSYRISNHITTAPSQYGPCVISPTNTTSSIQFSSPMTSIKQNDKKCTSFSPCVGAATGIAKDQCDSPSARSQEHETSSASRLGTKTMESATVLINNLEQVTGVLKKDQRGVKRPRATKSNTTSSESKTMEEPSATSSGVSVR